MSARGQPFRFLAVVAVGWIGARILLLWPQDGSLPDAIRALVPPRPAAALAPPTAPLAIISASTPTTKKSRPTRSAARPLTLAPTAQPPSPLILRRMIEQQLAAEPPPRSAFGQPQILLTRIGTIPDRWSASGWFVARAGSGVSAAPGGQLGGGQAGMRIAYMLAPRQRISAFGRVTAPLAGKGSEAAIGIEWQPWKAPIRLAIERRIGLDGAPGGTGAGVTAGLYEESAGFRIEGYGQAGAIARRRIESYADGAIRVTTGLISRLSLGAGAWGAAQRDAQRLDIGPSATVALGKVRVSLDWRQRIAGRARPGSGLALTLGSDF